MTNQQQSFSQEYVHERDSDLGSHSPTGSGGVEYQMEDTSSPPPSASVTPIRFVARHTFSKSLESPPRKKYRSNVLSTVDSQRVDRCRSTGPTVSHLDFLHDDASILARLDLSNVPNNEFILARPDQVSSSSFEIEYPAYMQRPRTVSISTNNADTDPIAYSEEMFGFLEERDFLRPPSSGPNPIMAANPSMFLPINEQQHLEASFSELRMEDTRGHDLRLKPRLKPRLMPRLMPRPGKRTSAHDEARPWDPEFTF
jgi:hypothetical protein